MTQRIYLFNPDNDLALAHAVGYYTAPRFAQKMQADLCTLPMWYAPKGSMVLVNDDRTRQWIETYSTKFQLGIKGITPEDLPKIHDAEFHPWGWSATLRQRLINMGVKPDNLPSEAQTRKIRNLAHRRNSIAIFQYFQAHTALHLPPTPSEVNNFDEVSHFAITHPGSYIKMPWSGSGKGIYHAVDPASAEFERWCRGAIKRQGSVMCEIGLKRTLDFALEYECSDGFAKLIGYSVFESDSHSQYSSGVVASIEALYAKITAAYPHFHQVIPVITQAIGHIYAKHYEGYIGVDMLLYDNDGETLLDPCVEVNLRATMGLVTCMVGENVMPKGATGKFKIEYSKCGFAKPSENRIYLSPIFSDTQYCAYVELD